MAEKRQIKKDLKVLRNIDGFITEDSNQLLTNGAYIELYNPMKFLEPKWIYKKDKKILSEFNNIPCVLGACIIANNHVNSVSVVVK